MLRTVVALLLVANLAFFAWTRGWLAPGLAAPRHAEHEPERLAAQVSPQAVAVLTQKAANAAVVAARAAAAVCMEAGPLGAAELAAAQAALATVQLPEAAWLREPAAAPPLWLVYAGRVGEGAARRTREAELRLLGLAFEVLSAPAELAPGLVLSRHDTRASAEAALAVLVGASAPLKGGRVVQLPTPAPRQWLRVPRAEPDQQARLVALPAAQLAGGFRPCAAPP